MTACLLVVAATLAVAGNASAATGQLTYEGCLGNTAQSCVDLPGEIFGAWGVAASPDGKSVYVASFAAGSISHFVRDGAGGLTYDSCLNNDGSNGCADVPGAPLNGPVGVAVSPDGGSVYVTSFGADSITRFSRDPAQGRIAYGDCLNNTGTQSCLPISGAPLDGPKGVAVSPDGLSVYVAAESSSSVVRFARTGAAGELGYDSCANDAGNLGCTDLPAAALALPNTVAVSPDSKSVYVTSSVGKAVSHIHPFGPGNQPTWGGCFSDTGSQGCTDVPGQAFNSPTGVAVSPNGKSVYVTSFTSASISRFGRDTSSGALAYGDCLADDAGVGCADLPGSPLSGANAVALTADGRSAYVVTDGGTLSHLVRNPGDGKLTFQGCLGDTTAQGCQDLPGDPLTGAQAVAVSPDGKSVYATSAANYVLSHFLRELPAPPAPGGDPRPPRPTTPGPAGGDSLAPRLTGLSLTKRRFRVGRRGTTFRYRLSERATVNVVIERRRRGRWIRVQKSITRRANAGPNRLRFKGSLGGHKLRPGAYRARFTATDPSGNRSRPARIRFGIARG